MDSKFNTALAAPEAALTELPEVEESHPARPNAPKAVIALIPTPPFIMLRRERLASSTSSKGLFLLWLKRVASKVSLLMVSLSQYSCSLLEDGISIDWT
ncbi:hypothetical protein VYA_28340 [Vibrio alfacsensis]|nr:hypothetical protein VYA_28340 [Vibrio alfacsensis]